MSNSLNDKCFSVNLNRDVYDSRVYPSQITFHENGEIMTVCWRINGKLHRENDLPAMITYNDDEMDCYWGLDGVVTRQESQPVCVSYYYHGGVKQELWGVGFQKNVTPGLDRVRYDEQGNITSKKYQVAGLTNLSFEEWIKNPRVIKYHRELKNNRQGNIATDVSF